MNVRTYGVLHPYSIPKVSVSYSPELYNTNFVPVYSWRNCCIDAHGTRKETNSSNLWQCDICTFLKLKHITDNKNLSLENSYYSTLSFSSLLSLIFTLPYAFFSFSIFLHRTFSLIMSDSQINYIQFQITSDPYNRIGYQLSKFFLITNRSIFFAPNRLHFSSQ